MTVFSYGQSKSSKRSYFGEDALSAVPEFDISAVQGSSWLLLDASERSAVLVEASVPDGGQPFIPTVLAIESSTVSLVSQNGKVGSVLQGPALAQALRGAISDSSVGLFLVPSRTDEKINYYTIRLGGE